MLYLSCVFFIYQCVHAIHVVPDICSLQEFLFYYACARPEWLVEASCSWIIHQSCIPSVHPFIRTSIRNIHYQTCEHDILLSAHNVVTTRMHKVKGQGHRG